MNQPKIKIGDIIYIKQEIFPNKKAIITNQSEKFNIISAIYYKEDKLNYTKSNIIWDGSNWELSGSGYPIYNDNHDYRKYIQKLENSK